MKSLIIGRLILTTCNQGGAAPLLDYCRVATDDDRVWWGRCLLLAPWLRNEWGESEPQLALVVAWAASRPPRWADPSRRRNAFNAGPSDSPET